MHNNLLPCDILNVCKPRKKNELKGIFIFKKIRKFHFNKKGEFMEKSWGRVYNVYYYSDLLLIDKYKALVDIPS